MLCCGVLSDTPNHPQRESDFFDLIGMLYPIFFLITYLYPSFWIIRNIVTEKERGIRETLKTMVGPHTTHHAIGSEGHCSGVVVVGHLHVGIPGDQRWLHADAATRVRVQQCVLVPVLLLVLLFRDDDVVLPRDVVLLESQNRGTAGYSDHLPYLRPRDSL